MKKIITSLVLLLSFCFAFQAMAASTGSTFTPAQKKAIDQRIHTYLLGHPQILLKMSIKLRQQQMQQQQSAAKNAVIRNARVLLGGPNTPVVGNTKGKVTLIEFFDYQCSVCERMFPIVAKIVKKNPNLRVVFRVFPIFGKVSVYAAQAGIASQMQGKYFAFHEALFASKHLEGSMTRKEVMGIARKVGLNMRKLRRDMRSSAVKKEIATNYALAKKLALAGTPAFVIAPTALKQGQQSKITFVPGATSYAVLQKGINAAA